MNAKELLSTIKTCAKNRLPLLTMGAPGVGKSALHAQAAEELGIEYKVLYPSTLDPVDLGGLPIPKDGRVTRMLDDDMRYLTEPGPGALLLIDEFAQSSPAMQAACAPLLLERTLGGRRLRDNIALFCASNRRKDRAGAGYILSHILSRMASVITLEPDAEEWCEWAASKKLSPSVVGLIHFRPSLLAPPIKDESETTPYPCPRSWEHTARLLEAGTSSAEVLGGAVGEGAALELITFITAGAEIDIDQLLKKPESWKKVKKNVATKYAVAVGAASRTAKGVYREIVTLGEVMRSSGDTEFSVLLLRDAVRYCHTFTESKEFKEMASSEMGKAILNA